MYKLNYKAVNVCLGIPNILILKDLEHFLSFLGGGGYKEVNYIIYKIFSLNVNNHLIDITLSYKPSE